ncbi:HutD family protein [Microvirga sp. 2YAF29]|uniref:HutD/Ves family protein n=1 Tax=Microvirga sp. 2YAF29 TaxID=3233031 RepID=UPI003F960687
MAPRLIRNQDLIRVPWKNGGGTTAQVASFPEGSTLDTFGWRISMADVASDGPFSSFPEIDRTLIVVEGAGIEIEMAGISHRLDPASPLLSFPGDVPTQARLLAGPIRDLNVMTRRGQFSHRTAFVQAGDITPSKDCRAAFLFGLDAALGMSAGTAKYVLQPLDALVLDTAKDSVVLSGPGRAILIEITESESGA